MANHSFVTTRKFLKVDQVEADLQYILNKRFGNKMSFTRDGDYFLVGFEWPYQVPLWLENVHKLEFRNGGPDWCWWVQTILHNEFALLYNGWISDECCDERWRGTPDHYPTIDSYFKNRVKGSPIAAKLMAHLLSFLEGAPKEVKATFNGVK